MNEIKLVCTLRNTMVELHGFEVEGDKKKKTIQKGESVMGCVLQSAL
jgi:hypothetical protein